MTGILGIRRFFILINMIDLSVRCPLATAPPFGTVRADGNGCHTAWVLSLDMCFLKKPISDSAAVCACIRQEILCSPKSVLCLTSLKDPVALPENLFCSFRSPGRLPFDGYNVPSFQATITEKKMRTIRAGNFTCNHEWIHGKHEDNLKIQRLTPKGTRILDAVTDPGTASWCVLCICACFIFVFLYNKVTGKILQKAGEK